MNSSEEYLDMYGVSPYVIGFIMTLVSLLSPYASYHVEFLFFGFFLQPGLYAPIWVLLYSMPFGLHFMNPYYVLGSLSMAIPNLFFLFWIVRYYQGKTSRFSTIVLGGISVLLPLAVAISQTNLALVGIYSGPLPIQFIIGLIVLYRIEGPELEAVWEGQPLASVEEP